MEAAKGYYKCQVCNSRFSGKRTLKQHEDSIHKSMKFECQNCGKQITFKEAL